MKLSVLMPSIRMHLLETVYNSLVTSFHGEFELIIISPYPLPFSLQNNPKIVYIYDAGTPIRARQIGLLAARGEYICYAADDVIFYPDSLDIAYGLLKDKDYKTLVLGKYLEGQENNPFMKSDSYYYLSTHDFLKPVIAKAKKEYLLLNTGLISRKLMLEIGGFDCTFEACAMACVDLSIRLQNYGANIIIQQEPIFHASHLPGNAGDHGCIDKAQVIHDQPRFLFMYLNSDNLNRTKIDINNWENAPSWWTRRFGIKPDE